ncbi:hypothetical protein [Planotetraspora silvatica]
MIGPVGRWLVRPSGPSRRMIIELADEPDLDLTPQELRDNGIDLVI